MACLDCKFFVEGAENVPTHGFGMYDGLCKVLPPQITFDSHANYGFSVWPEVMESDFCSLWQKR